MDEQAAEGRVVEEPTSVIEPTRVDELPPVDKEQPTPVAEEPVPTEQSRFKPLIPQPSQTELIEELRQSDNLDTMSPHIKLSSEQKEQELDDEDEPDEPVPPQSFTEDDSDLVDKMKTEKLNQFLKYKEQKHQQFFEKNQTNPHIYPHLDDADFNSKISAKKEFQFMYDGKIINDADGLKQHADALCKMKTFLKPHQEFVKSFLSTQTPYNGLLLFHGTGTGKTCAAIGITENMRDYLKYSGKKQRIIVVASPNVQDNFKTQLFDERNLKQTTTGWELTGCNGNKFLDEIDITQLGRVPKQKVIEKNQEFINNGGQLVSISTNAPNSIYNML